MYHILNLDSENFCSTLLTITFRGGRSPGRQVRGRQVARLELIDKD